MNAFSSMSLMGHRYRLLNSDYGDLILNLSSQVPLDPEKNDDKLMVRISY